jgi:hypothetical protein
LRIEDERTSDEATESQGRPELPPAVAGHPARALGPFGRALVGLPIGLLETESQQIRRELDTLTSIHPKEIDSIAAGREKIPG